MKVDIVYNLFAFQSDVFLPNAFIVSQDKDGYLTHILQKATPATIGAFGLALDSTRERLFRLMDSLQPAELARPYQKKGRKPTPLEDLLNDKDNREVRRAISRQIDRLLDEWLRLITTHHYPLTWNAERKALVQDFILQPIAEPLQPMLFFRKTATGVDYQLRLTEAGRPWRIAERQVEALVNNPAWIMADYKLYRIEYVNGYLVKPFRDRDEVNIPAASVNAYFKNFILRVAAKVEIEAEGFAVQQFGRLEACRLEPVRHLFEDRWVLSVQMRYANATFNWNETRSQRLSLEVSADEVRIVQVRRDAEAEQRQLALLAPLGVAPSPDGSHYQLLPAAPATEDGKPLPDDTFAVVYWLARHKAALMAAGFEVVAPQVDEQEVQLHEARIEWGVAAGNDWLDLNGLVRVGEFSFPFLMLARHIRDGNRFYPLPDGSLFVIPEEWMARYRDVASLGQKSGEALRLAKSQYTLLYGIGLSESEAGIQSDSLAEVLPPEGLRAQLRPYQLEGFRWLVRLYQQGLGACLADDMGLGKTLQTIAALLYAKHSRKKKQSPTVEANYGNQLNLFGAPPDDHDFLNPLGALIIMPASLLYNWESEIRQFAPSLSVYQHVGPKRYKDTRLLARFDVVLTTYQTALRDEALLSAMTFEYVVLDESQQIKNRESKVYKSLSHFEARHKVSLSGTPIENSLADLWSQMQFINPDLLGGFTYFQKEFIYPIERQQDDRQKAKLRQLVQPYLLRRTKEEVAPDLPPLTTQLFYTEMSAEQRKFYEREKSAARNYLLDNFQPDSGQYRLLVVQTLTKLRQLVNHPILVNPDYERESGKFNDVVEQWEVVRKSGHKVLIFSSFVQYLELFRRHFEAVGAAYAWLTGDLSPKQRQKAINEFQQQAGVQTFLISIKSGGAGLNLTAADYVFILDPWWNPTTEQQAIARAHRIGQNRSVFALKFITKDSIEEKILKLREKKSQLAEDIIGQVEQMDFDRESLQFLLE